MAMAIVPATSHRPSQPSCFHELVPRKMRCEFAGGACGGCARPYYLRVRPSTDEMNNLIRVGAFDCFGESRTAQFWEFRELAQWPQVAGQSLPPVVENALDDAMIRWAHEGRSWPEIDELLLQLKPGGLESAVRRAELLSESIGAHLPQLKTGPEGKSVRLSETAEITGETIKLLACAFLRSSPGGLLLPVVGMKEGTTK